jgi:hypothetical protein
MKSRLRAEIFPALTLEVACRPGIGGPEPHSYEKAKLRPLSHIPAASHIPIALPESPTLSIFRTRARSKELQKRSCCSLRKCWTCAENIFWLQETSVELCFGGALVYYGSISAKTTRFKPHFILINQ